MALILLALRPPWSLLLLLQLLQEYAIEVVRSTRWWSADHQQQQRFLAPAPAFRHLRKTNCHMSKNGSSTKKILSHVLFMIPLRTGFQTMRNYSTHLLLHVCTWIFLSIKPHVIIPERKFWSELSTHSWKNKKQPLKLQLIPVNQFYDDSQFQTQHGGWTHLTSNRKI
jgi:hypothetical protein